MSLYNVFNMIAACMVLLYSLLQFKKKKTLLGGVSLSVIGYFGAKPQRGINKILSSLGLWVILETCLIYFAQYGSIGLLNNTFGNLVGTGSNYFGLVFFAPLLVVLLCIILRIDPLSQLDLVAPAYPLGLIFVKIACHFGGCCQGIEWENGLYNPVTRLIEFPAQLLEAGAAFVLFVFLFSLRNKFKKGTIFPIYLMAYSAIRFFTEFTRWEPSVFLGLKTYQILCITGVLVGALEYFLVCKYNAYVQQKANKKGKGRGKEKAKGSRR